MTDKTFYQTEWASRMEDARHQGRLAHIRRVGDLRNEFFRETHVILNCFGVKIPQNVWKQDAPCIADQEVLDYERFFSYVKSTNLDDWKDTTCLLLVDSIKDSKQLDKVTRDMLHNLLDAMVFWGYQRRCYYDEQTRIKF